MSDRVTDVSEMVPGGTYRYDNAVDNEKTTFVLREQRGHQDNYDLAFVDGFSYSASRAQLAAKRKEIGILVVADPTEQRTNTPADDGDNQ